MIRFKNTSFIAVLILCFFICLAKIHGIIRSFGLKLLQKTKHSEQNDMIDFFSNLNHFFELLFRHILNFFQVNPKSQLFLFVCLHIRCNIFLNLICESIVREESSAKSKDKLIHKNKE